MDKDTMDLDDLYHSGNMSIRAYGVCREFGFHDIPSVVDYYQDKGSFLKFRNCGMKTNLELIDICKRYEALNKVATSVRPDDDSPLGVTIQDLYDNQRDTNLAFSSDTHLVCKLNDLLTVKDILDHFNRYGNYRNLRYRNFRNSEKTEKKTIAELTTIHDVYQLKNMLYIDAANPGNREWQKDLSAIERSAVDGYIQLKLKGLSVRGVNALAAYLEGDFHFANFDNQILSNPNFHVRNLKKAGIKTGNEIEHFIETIRSFTEEIIRLKSENEKREFNNKIVMQRLFPYHRETGDLHDSNAILSVVDHLISNGYIFKGSRNKVFRECFAVFDDSPVETIDISAKKIGLTCERTRQIRIEILEDLFDHFGFVKVLYDPFLEGLNIDNQSPVLWMDEKFAAELNRACNTRFSLAFLTLLFGIIKADYFSVIGVLSDVLVNNRSRSRKRHNWNRIYLINRKIADSIDFVGVMNEISAKAASRNDENIEIDIHDFLKPYLISAPTCTFTDIESTLGRIIELEFNRKSVVLENGVIQIYRNTLVLTYEYALEALNELGKPAHAEEIALKVMELFPEYITTGDQLRYAMMVRPEFKSIGRTSVYGLTKWANERSLFRGGSIREIVRSYLEEFSKPVKINQVANHVLKFRPQSNEASIRSNLLNDRSGKFVFFAGGKVGLATKAYFPDFHESPVDNSSTRKSWKQSYNEQIDFIKSHNRLPRSTFEPESKYYRWLQFQKLQLKRNNLSDDKAEKVKEILNQYTSKGPASIAKKRGEGGESGLKKDS